MIQILQLFVREFFDQNPLSHLSIMMLRNGRAERLTELSGSPVRPSLCSPLSVSASLLAFAGILKAYILQSMLSPYKASLKHKPYKAS